MFCFSLGKFWPQEEEGEIKTSDLTSRGMLPSQLCHPLVLEIQMFHCNFYIQYSKGLISSIHLSVISSYSY